MRHLTIREASIALYLRNNSNYFTGSDLVLEDNGSEGLRVISGAGASRFTKITARNNARDGISIETAIDSISDCTVHGNARYGIYVTQVNEVKNCLVYDNIDTGLYMYRPGTATVDGNTVHSNGRGMYIDNNTGLALIGSDDLSLRRGNKVYGNTGHGIYSYSGNILVAGNAVYGQTGTNAFGIYMRSGGTVSYNAVYDNTKGIYVYNATADNNRVYNNAADGIQLDYNASARSNTVYSNATGILASSSSWHDIENNLIYSNSLRGIHATGTSGNRRITNNTIYQPLGDAISIYGSATSIRLRNNILWAMAGYCINVASNSQVGFSSDHNVLYSTDEGIAGFWQNAARGNLSQWQNASSADMNSISVDPLFVNPVGIGGQLGYVDAADDGRDDDFHLKSIHGSYQGGSFAPVIGVNGLPMMLGGAWVIDEIISPAIDRGDLSSYANEPEPNGGFINMGAYGNTVQASKSAAQYILMIRPDGGEVWPAQQTFNIEWRSHDWNGTVDIDLMVNGEEEPSYSIVSDAANSGAYSWTIPTDIPCGDEYLVRVTRKDIELSDSSASTFSIIAPISTYYVNDGSVEEGDWTTAPGDDSNDGLTPATPKASINALLQSYALGAGDTIMVDAGVYQLTGNILISAANAGIRIVGYNEQAYPERSAVISRGSSASGNVVFDVRGEDVIIEHLSITGGNIGVRTVTNAGAHRLIVRNCTIYSNYLYGIGIWSGNDDVTIADNEIYAHTGDYYARGIYIYRVNRPVIAGNVIFDNRWSGIYAEQNGIAAANGLVIANNVIRNNRCGTETNYSQTTIINNTIHGNSSDGINSYGQVIVQDNLVYSNSNGIYSTSASGSIISGNTSRNNGSMGLYVDGSNDVCGNVIYANATGINIRNGVAYNNRVFNNTGPGMYTYRGTIRGNLVYSNSTGIHTDSDWPVIENNVVYANSVRGMLIRGTSGTRRVANNTVYQPVGHGIRVYDSATNIILRNNIIVVEQDNALIVDTNSQMGFSSDYNLFYFDPNGAFGQWGSRIFTDRADWYMELGRDGNSIVADPLFVNAVGADGILGYDNVAGIDGGEDDDFTIQTGSPVIDTGDPTYAHDQERDPNGGRVNIGAYGNTPLAATSASMLVQVLAPVGFEKFIPGQVYAIRWRTFGLDDITTIDIDLVQGTDTVDAVAVGIENSGEFIWTVPVLEGSDYRIKVSGNEGDNIYGLSEIFLITNDDPNYYVNSDSVENNVFTSAPGDNAHSGKSPDQPVASLRALLASYTLKDGDIVHVDAGTYVLLDNIVIENRHKGFTIKGPDTATHPDSGVVLNRSNTGSGNVAFDVKAEDVTIEHLSITGGNIGVRTVTNAGAHRLMISNCKIYSNHLYGVGIWSGNDDVTITENEISAHTGDYYARGVYIYRVNRPVISGNEIFDNRWSGIYTEQNTISAANGLVITNNVVVSNRLGIETNYSLTTIINNTVYGNSSGGIITYGQVIVQGNLVHSNSNGIYSSSASGSVISGNAVRNNSSTGLYVDGSNDVCDNIVYGNPTGIHIRNGVAYNNRVFNNTGTGMYTYRGTLRANQVYSNATGIQTDNDWSAIENNIVYANSVRGMLVRGTSGTRRVANNTIYQPVGHGIRVYDSATNIILRNNIIAVEQDNALIVDANSQAGFSSDYNLFYLEPNATLGQWGSRIFTERADWYLELGRDGNSIVADPLLANPFGADGILGYDQVAGIDGGEDDDFTIQTGSPVIDTGDPSYSYDHEPEPNGGRINIGAYGNTPLAATSPSIMVQVMAPVGLEKLVPGQEYTIRWRTSGLNAETTIDIDLIQGADTVDAVAAGIENTGEFVWTIPSDEGSNYRIRVAANEGDNPHGVSGIFLITNDGPNYYVNDDSIDNDVFTTAPGDNANSGKSPDQPMAGLRALLAAYTLKDGDVVHIDAGTYLLLDNILIENHHRGFTIKGPDTVAHPESNVVLNRSNTGGGNVVFDVRTEDITIEHLSITGGNIGVSTVTNAAAHRLAIKNCRIYSNHLYGIGIWAGNDDVTIADNEIFAHTGDYYARGIYIYRVNRPVISGNEIFDNRWSGIYAEQNGILAANGLVIADNIVANNRFGMEINYSLTTISNNTIHGNSNDGINTWGQVIMEGNLVHSNSNGIYSTSASGSIISGNVARNNSSTGLYVDGSNDVFENVVYANATGMNIRNGVAYNNRAFNNTGTGIYTYRGTIRGNRVYSNSTGIQTDTEWTAIESNLVYANSARGLYVRGTGWGRRITNNTVYQSVGNAIHLYSSANTITLRNNIIAVDAGHCIYVESNSQSNFSSDYNLFHTGSAQTSIGFWDNASRASIGDWQAVSGRDTNSIVGNPLFMDIDGADNILGYSTVHGYDGGLDDNFHLKFGSPAVGIAEIATATPTDIDGFQRTETPDVGAYEFRGAGFDTPPTVVSTNPSLIHAEASSSQTFDTIIVSFSQPLNSIDANAPANYELVGAGPSGEFNGIDDVTYTLIPSYTTESFFVALEIAEGPLPIDDYRLTIFGETSIRNPAGIRLDGDEDGNEGGNYVRFFSIAHALQVASSPMTSVIMTGDQTALTPFTAYATAGTITVIAPSIVSVGDVVASFALWRLDDVDQEIGETTLVVDMNASRAAEAVYSVPKPVTTLTTTPSEPDGLDNWFIGAQPQVHLNAVGAVVTELRYKWNEGQELTASGASATLNLPTEQNSLTYYGIDQFGQAEAPQQATFKYDVSTPSVSIQLAGTQGANGYRSDVTVAIESDGDGKAITSTEYKVGSSEWTAYTEPFAITAEGTHTVSARIATATGKTATSSSAFLLDKTPPVTVFTTTPSAPNGADGWFISQPTVRLAATDAGSGLEKIVYRWNDGAYVERTSSPTTFSAPAAINTLEYYSVDKVGNVEDVQQAIVKYDDSTPTIVMELEGTVVESLGYSSDVTVTVTADGDGKEISAVEYRIGGGAWTPYTDPVVRTSEGSHSISARVTTVTGKTASTSRTFIIDKYPPVTVFSTTPSTPNGADGWFISQPTVRLNASDPGSGVARIMYRWNAGEWVQIANNTTFAAPAGINALEFYAVDNFGNEEAPQQAIVKYDDSTPTIVMELAGTLVEGLGYSSDVTVTVTADGDGKDISAVEYRIASGPWTSYTGAVVRTAEGTHSISARVTTVTGKTATTGTTFIIDKNPPVTAFSTVPSTPNEHGWFVTTRPQIYLNATDAGSGVAQVVYSVNGGEWVHVDGSSTNFPALNGVNTIQYYAVDNFGYVEATKEAVVRYDGAELGVTITLAGTEEPLGYSSDVTVTVEGQGEGIIATEYRIGGGAWTPYTEQVVITAEGTCTFYARVITATGKTATTSRTFIIDKNPPVTVFSTTPSAPNGFDGWFVTQPQVRLNASDPGSGVAKIVYSWNGGNVVEVPNNTIFFAPAGVNTLEYHAVDNFGNLEAPQQATVKYDASSPTVTIELDGTEGGTGWYKSNVSASVTGNGDGLQILSTQIRIGSGSWVNYANPITFTNEGTHTVSARITTYHGKTVNVTSTFVIDLGPPVTTLSTNPATPNGLDDWFIIWSPSISLWAADAGVGVKEIHYQWDDGTVTVVPQASAQFNAPLGISTLTYWAVDHYNQAEEPQQREIKFDDSRPDLIVESVTVSPQTVVLGNQLDVTWVVKNIGTVPTTTGWTDLVSLIGDTSTCGDLLLTVRPSPGMVLPDATYTRTATVTLPLKHCLDAGEYQVRITADFSNAQVEADKDNNTGFSNPFTITLPPFPDLQVIDVSIPQQGFARQVFDVSWTVMNTGEATAVAPWSDAIRISNDNQIGNDTMLGMIPVDVTLDTGELYQTGAQFNLPSTPGLYWIVVQTDSLDNVKEHAGELNNSTISLHPVEVMGYTATVSTDIEMAPAGTDIPLQGIAQAADGTPVPGVPVTVRILKAGTRRLFETQTDEQGMYSVTFRPLPTEAGRYYVAAAAPWVSEDVVQDEFVLLGMRCEPELVSMTIDAGAERSGSVQVRNLNDIPLTDITASVVAASGTNAGDNLEVEVTQPESLPANGTASLDYIVRALDDTVSWSGMEVVLASAEGAVARLRLSVSVRPLRPVLTVSPTSLNTSMLVGSGTITGFDITNTGAAASGPLNILLPVLPWMTLNTPSVIQNLDPGQTARVELNLMPDAELGLGPYTGSLVVSGQLASASVPFRFVAVSEAIGDLHITAVDEFTYYAEGSPKVSGAAVTLRNAVTHEIAATGVTDENGELLLTGLTHAYYNISITAEKHGAFNSTILIPAGDVLELTAFLPRELVTYKWSVVPTEIEDKYIFVIESTFETNVPAPVVTIAPNLIDLNNYTEETNQVNIVITNHGLIAAQNVKLNLGTHPHYELILLADDLGELQAKSSTVVPLIINRLVMSSSDITAASNVDCKVYGRMDYSFPCGPSDQHYSQGITLTNAYEDCFKPYYYVGGIHYHSPNGWGSITYAPVGSSPGIPHVNSPGFDLPDPCDGCAWAVGQCIVSLILEFPVLKGVSCVANIVMGMGNTAAALLSGGVSASAARTAGNSALSILSSCTSAVATPISIAWTIVNCIDSIMSACDLSISSADAEVINAMMRAQGVDYNLDQLMEQGARLRAMAEVFIELLGDPIWLSGEVDEGDLLSGWLEIFMGFSAEESEGSALITDNERMILLDITRPSQITIQHVNTFIHRWNRSVNYWEMGIFTIDDVPDGWSTDFILIYGLAEKAQAAAEAAAANLDEGQEDLLEGVRRAGMQVLEDDNEGVCATVRIKLGQEAVITRSAFLATLELTNESPMSRLEDISIRIDIRDANGEPAEDYFGIRAPQMSGITGIDGTGIIMPNSTGKIEWIIIPNRDAAPEEPTPYSVGGEVIYRLGDSVLTIPLFRETITVMPDPLLEVKYFHEREVYGDDPFTDIVEPPVPYSLGIMMFNTGKGTARNVRITSAQPEIVDNEKGLLIEFKIIGAQVGTQPVSPSLTINLGDIEPGKASVGRWLLTSTLHGRFIDYKASYQHVDDLGDPRLSLIDSVSIHTLIRVVNAHQPVDDGLPDFLVDDGSYPDDLPDVIHSSDGSLLPVTPVTEGQFIGTLSPENLEIQLTAQMEPGWTYLRIDEPGEELYILKSVMRSDGQELPIENAWTTHKTRRPKNEPEYREHFLHLLDYNSTGSYTLVYEASPAATDVTAPVTQVLPLPPVVFDTSFTVQWAGEDEEDGTGLAYYEIWVSINGEPYYPWLLQTRANGAIYYGSVGNTYSFYSRGVDYAANRQDAPEEPHTQTIVADPQPYGVTVNLAPDSDSGVPGDNITNAANPDFAGTTRALSIVTITITGPDEFSLTDTTVTDFDGTWYYNMPIDMPLPDGWHVVTVSAIDIGGTESADDPTLDLLIDTIPPVSAIEPLPATSQTTFTLNWSGEDESSGLLDFDIYFSESGGAFSTLLEATESTSLEFTGQPGKTYSFYSIARDVAGNVQAPEEPHASTTIKSTFKEHALLGDANLDCTVDTLDLIFIRTRLGADVSVSNNWQADVNYDGVVNMLDLILVRNQMGEICPERSWPITGDVNHDCVVDTIDMIIIRERFGANVNIGDNWKADVNQDGAINLLDLIIARNNLGAVCPTEPDDCPTIGYPDLTTSSESVGLLLYAPEGVILEEPYDSFNVYFNGNLLISNVAVSPTLGVSELLTLVPGQNELRFELVSAGNDECGRMEVRIMPDWPNQTISLPQGQSVTTIITREQ